MIKSLKDSSPDTADGHAFVLIEEDALAAIAESLGPRSVFISLRGSPVQPGAKRPAYVKCAYRHVVGVENVQFVPCRQIPVAMTMGREAVTVPCRHIRRRGRRCAKSSKQSRVRFARVAGGLCARGAIHHCSINPRCRCAVIPAKLTRIRRRCVHHDVTIRCKSCVNGAVIAGVADVWAIGWRGRNF